MSRHAAPRSRRPRRLAILVVAAALVVAPALAAHAAWSGSTSGAGSDVTAGALGSGTAPTARQVAGGRTVALTWPATASATSYVVKAWTSATGGTATTVCTTSGTSCTDTTTPTNATWYSVQSQAGTGWTTESARTAYAPDASTTVTITGIGTDTGASATDLVTSAAPNTLVGTAEPGAAIVVRRSGSQVATATANASGAWTSGTFTLLEGSQTLTATATDAFANTATTSTVVRLDTVPPAVVASPATCGTTGNAVANVSGASWCRQTSLGWTMTATDADSGVDTRQYDDGSGLRAYTGTVTMGQGAAKVMTARASDVAGNVATATSTSWIDGTGPTLAVGSPVDGTTYASYTDLAAKVKAACGTSVAACGTVADAVSGVASTGATWKLQRTKPGLFGATTQCLSGSGSWSSCSAANSITLGPSWSLGSGSAYEYPGLLQTWSYTLTTTSTDAAGNTTTLTTAFTD